MTVVIDDEATEMTKRQAEKLLTEHIPDLLNALGVDVFNECGISCDMEIHIKD